MNYPTVSFNWKLGFNWHTIQIIVTQLSIQLQLFNRLPCFDARYPQAHTYRRIRQINQSCYRGNLPNIVHHRVFQKCTKMIQINNPTPYFYLEDSPRDGTYSMWFMTSEVKFLHQVVFCFGVIYKPFMTGSFAFVAHAL